MSEWSADGAAVNIVRTIVSALQGRAALEEDTGLESLWDEICVQVQIEESSLWDGYESVIDGEIEIALEDLDTEKKRALWSLTDNGRSWEVGDIDGSSSMSPPSVPWSFDDLLSYFRESVLAEACDWNNSAIEIYKENLYSLDDDTEFESADDSEE